MKTAFIAEHNEDGNISWIWHVAPGKRCPSAIWTKEDLNFSPDDVEFIGDSSDRISEWITEHREQLICSP